MGRDGGDSKWGDKGSIELNSNRMSAQVLQNLANEIKKCFEDQRNLKKNYESNANEIEETSFNDAARWAMNQKKKV